MLLTLPKTKGIHTKKAFVQRTRQPKLILNPALVFNIRSGHLKPETKLRLDSAPFFVSYRQSHLFMHCVVFALHHLTWTLSGLLKLERVTWQPLAQPLTDTGAVLIQHPEDMHQNRLYGCRMWTSGRLTPRFCLSLSDHENQITPSHLSSQNEEVINLQKFNYRITNSTNVVQMCPSFQYCTGLLSQK